ncbi:transcription antitermination factor NusB [Companilactobacillus sp.]|uniref:transcription antitermination factor NusB n=1 Tax=Companilactobacillus sp. TaxID=2767905 RepID=UPI0025B93AD6|nr:transcription antitermination factor NusB [Companilactobacillus sp.]MCH4008025.1 transcription antitermination factor NusB [Companilactobacillus sp.]MCH4051796.1 transcription antitermination factor NusB [Companilactobacillus sp.]MCH4075968.1 transcription antitermination factor NusB [Companilactobacillus sp.]MCH4124543.1 transcription antitermination factor NusB [Companilactobacillus sp.]MCH4132494.1 transcription antitermination factor NusB [Companilactobacillus sp.]
MSINRHEIRELAVQSLFSIDTTKADAETAIRSTLELSDMSDVEVPDYLTFLVSGTLEKESELDEQISKKLKNKWTIARLSRIDRAILRMGLFEMQNSLEVPKKVAIDEAIELAGDFGDKDSKAFVNGILSNFVEG